MKKLGIVGVAAVAAAMLVPGTLWQTAHAGTAPACELTCDANVNQSNDPNQCGAVATFDPPTVGGTCGSVFCSPPSGSFFPVGTTTVTCSDDTDGGCTLTVTINDTQPPSTTCVSNTSPLDVDEDQGEVVNFSPPSTSDNCPGVTASCTPPSGSLFPVGTTTITCTSTDVTGNTATCTFTATVVPCAIVDPDCDDGAPCEDPVVPDCEDPEPILSPN